MRTTRILIVCGTSIATATLGAAKLREEFGRRKIPLDVKQAKTVDFRSSVATFRPDIVVAMAHVEGDLGIPKVNGMPLLTKAGLDAFWETLFGIVAGLDKERGSDMA